MISVRIGPAAARAIVASARGAGEWRGEWFTMGAGWAVSITAPRGYHVRGSREELGLAAQYLAGMRSGPVLALEAAERAVRRSL